MNKEVVRINLLVIREIIKYAKGNIPLPCVYTYLFSDKDSISTDYSKKVVKKSEQKVSTFIANGEGNLSKLFNRLTDYGISRDFFVNIPIIGQYSFNKYIKYLEIKNEGYDDMIENIKNNILFYENPDGSLIIDCIRNIILDIKNLSPNSYLYTIVDKASDSKQTFSSNNQAIDYYKHVANTIIVTDFLPEESTEIIRIDKISQFATSDIIIKNLFLIIETFRCLQWIDAKSDANETDEIDDMIDDRLIINYLGLDAQMERAIYQNDDSVKLPCRAIAEKIAPYKIPTTYFRKDSTTSIKCTKEISTAINDYFLDFDIEDFREILLTQLIDNVDTKNLIFVMGVYSLYRTLKLNAPQNVE